MTEGLWEYPRFEIYLAYMGVHKGSPSAEIRKTSALVKISERGFGRTLALAAFKTSQFPRLIHE
jgi:hypothetical protein